MTTIVTRAGKGSPLTHTEVDTNFTNLNTNKLEAGAIALGSAATPSISFTGDTNTGIYSPGADQLAVATSGTEKARIDSSGRLLVGTVTGNANGGILQLSGGITFPATAVAASDVNTLDDYEEGTWTPTHVSGLASGGFSGAAGTYTKIGQIVTVHMITNFTAGFGTASLSAKLIIGGLPFSANTGGGPTVGGESNLGGELPWSVSNTRTDGSQMIINAIAYPTLATMNRLDVNSTYSLA